MLQCVKSALAARDSRVECAAMNYEGVIPLNPIIALAIVLPALFALAYKKLPARHFNREKSHFTAILGVAIGVGSGMNATFPTYEETVGVTLIAGAFLGLLGGLVEPVTARWWGATLRCLGVRPRLPEPRWTQEDQRKSKRLASYEDSTPLD